jgi:hypothetical protein
MPLSPSPRFLSTFVIQEGVAEWMLVEGVHDLTCDGRGGLDVDVETVQGDILSQADALPDCMKLIRLSKVTLGFSCSSLTIICALRLC